MPLIGTPLRLTALLISLFVPGLALATWGYHSGRSAEVLLPGKGDDELAEVGQLAFANDCLMCHGAGIVEQQHLNPTQWKAEIQKMIGLGATVAPEDVNPIQAYLEASFGPTHKPELVRVAKPKVIRVEPEPLAQVQPERGQVLFADQCAKCHGTDARGGEPGQNLVGSESLVAIKPFRQIVAEGRRKMPGFEQVLKPADSDNILAWLRTLKYTPAGLEPTHR